MKLALHRSITFWSGLLVMGFIVWAWRDSREFSSGVALRKFTVAHGGNGITIWTRGDRPDWWRVRSRNKFIAGPCCPPPLFIRNEDAVREVFGERGPQTRGIDLDAISTQNLDAYNRTMTTWRHYLVFKMAMNYHGPWQAFVPHWLLLSVAAVLWVALLAWRGRTRKRTTTP